MGSLLPGWDCDPHEPPKGVGAELLDERRSLEKELHGGGRRPSVDTQDMTLTGPPSLSRKSAPSSFIIRKIQQAFPEEEDDDPYHQQTSEATKPGEGKTSKVISRLFSRDKWWRKFSSANLNELTEEDVKMKGQHTYTPQFDLVGSDPYTKSGDK